MKSRPMNIEVTNDRCHILVIDDNQDIYTDFQSILIDQADTRALDILASDYFGDQPDEVVHNNNYELHYAPQGKEGVDKVKKSIESKTPFALAFVDMRMPPGWDGLETIEHLWKIDPDVQVVICTAYSDYSWEEVIDRVGRTDKLLILKKPFDTAEVAQLASALTKKWSLLKKASMKMNEIEQMVEKRTIELEKINVRLQEESTERKRAMDTLKKTNKALENSLEALKSTQNQLVQSEKMAALGNLVAGVAHEINTPLGVGITAASFLNEKTENYSLKYQSEDLKRSDLEKYLMIATESSAMILTNLNRAADLVTNFKQVAVDRSTGERRTFELKDYTEKLLFSLEPKLKQTKHTIIINCPEIKICSYPGIFSQIITNLVMNSLIHGFNGIDRGIIKIDISKEKNLLIICYTDNGNGMDRETLDKIFDPFFTTNRSSGGTGLGMHILYNLVTQSLDGEMECTSKPEKGVVFFIRVPIE